MAYHLRGRWPEYFFNGVPIYSLLPDPDRFAPYSQFGELPVLEEDTDGEGPRTPTMSRERILADLDELLWATESLVAGRLGTERLYEATSSGFSGSTVVTDLRSTPSTTFTRSSCSAEGNGFLMWRQRHEEMLREAEKERLSRGRIRRRTRVTKGWHTTWPIEPMARWLKRPRIG